MPKLTAAFVRTVKATDRLKRYGDGNGLYLLVKPSVRGGKSWVQRIAVHGKRRDLGLGSAELVSLADARQAAFDNRRLARSGGDPRALGKRTSPTFAEATENVIAMHRSTWRSGAGWESQWRQSLADYAYPRIGDKPVQAIDAADVMAVLTPIWSNRHATAKRIRQRIGAVMKWAVAQGYRPDNPAGDALGAALPRWTPRPRTTARCHTKRSARRWRRSATAPPRPGRGWRSSSWCCARSAPARRGARSGARSTATPRSGRFPPNA